MNKLFILGCPRSGTTMVQQALNRHSQIVIPPETKLFLSFFGHCPHQQARHVAQLNEDLGIRLTPPVTVVRTREEGRAFFDAMAHLYVAKVQRTDAKYFGEKTPWHTGYLPRIREMFPEAKILVLYRDGRDVAFSLSQMPWMSPDLYVNFLVWLYYSRVVREAQTRAWPNLLFARYEDIVANPENAFQDILQFLDLPYEPVVAYGQGNREGIVEREYLWKARALGKITNQRVGTFHHQLTAKEIGVLERMGGRSLKAFGYPLVTDGKQTLPLGFILRAAYNLGRFALRLPKRSVAHELLNLTSWWRQRATPSKAWSSRAHQPRHEASSGQLDSSPDYERTSCDASDLGSWPVLC